MVDSERAAPSGDSASILIAEMQAYYGQRAPLYNASMGYDKPEVIASLAPIVDTLRDEMRGRTVLEIACGPGFWTRRIAEAARFIVASDYNESTLTVARADPAAPLNATFVRADAYDLSAVEETFSGAFAVDWLAHVPRSRLPVFFATLHQRLAADARVAFCDQTPRETSFTGIHDAEGNHLQERELPDGTRHRVIKHFFSDAEFHHILSPYTDTVTVRRFEDQRRVLVSYTML